MILSIMLDIHSRLWQRRFHMLVLLSAVETVLAFSCFGFISMPPISLTTLHIPVLLAALVYGRWGGAVLGAVFGVLSACVATNLSFIPADRVFSPFLSGNPLGSIVAAVGTRILFGWIAGWAFGLVKHSVHKGLNIGLASYLLAGLHGLLVFTALHAFFPNLGFTPLSLMERIASLANLYDGCLAAVLVPQIYLWLFCRQSREKFRHIFSQTYTMIFDTAKSRLLLAFSSVLFLTSLALVWHFISQIQRALMALQGNMPAGLSELMLGWGLQFVLAITAVSFLLFAVITYYYNLSHEALEKARRDPLTALYNKGSIVELVDAQLKDKRKRHGAFLMMDVDHFKTVNDSFGHPMGDQILRGVAGVLECMTREGDLVGRLVGDEFCIYLTDVHTKEDALRVAQSIQQGLADILMPDGTPVTLSMGMVLADGQTTFNEFYAKADEALYESKERGRNCCSVYKEMAVLT